MESFLTKVTTAFPELRLHCDVVAAEPDEHNRWCLLYNTIIHRHFVYGGYDDEDLEPLIIAWFRLVSSTPFRRRTTRLYDRGPKDRSMARPPSPPSRSDADSPRVTAWLAEFEWP